MVEVANEGYEQDFKDQLYFSSFTAWQINETITTLFGSNKKPVPFSDYLNALGLNEKGEKHQNNNSTKKEALETAQNIVHLFKKGRENIDRSV